MPLIAVFDPAIHATIMLWEPWGLSPELKPAKTPTPVLCVDLDGTLIRGNVLWECVLVLLKTRPIALLLLPYWLLAGRASFKRTLAAKVQLDPARLPYRQQVLDLLE